MTHEEKRIYLIKYLLRENGDMKNINIPKSDDDQKRLLRSLFNVRMAKDADKEFLQIQDEYLKEAIENKGINDYKKFTPITNTIYLWQGDITTIRCDAIVNAANSGMTGCYIPNHNCIDNAIHTYAGVELRYECDKIMKKQGHEETTGNAKITKGYNLPAKYIIHTVGPIVNNILTLEDKKLLKSCYLKCLELAKENKLSSIAFCCISTGIFGFPNDEAAKIAVETVKEFLKEHKIDVIFNVFKDIDYEIYLNLLKLQQ